jgi:hypothetical protein
MMNTYLKMLALPVGVITALSSLAHGDRPRITRTLRAERDAAAVLTKRLASGRTDHQFGSGQHIWLKAQYGWEPDGSKNRIEVTQLRTERSGGPRTSRTYHFRRGKDGGFGFDYLMITRGSMTGPGQVYVYRGKNLDWDYTTATLPFRGALMGTSTTYRPGGERTVEKSFRGRRGLGGRVSKTTVNNKWQRTSVMYLGTGTRVTHEPGKPVTVTPGRKR